ncbi:MAG: peptidogalycan biosysnthesis protein, partial [Myxococcota bacterium]
MVAYQEQQKLHIEIVPSLAEVAPGDWDALGDAHYPFVEHVFLRLLETSKSVGRGTGWEPAYVLAKWGTQLVGALPTYVKTDSYGEYIFDWEWANVAAQCGLAYYPKIVVGIPFTPATGPRLLSVSQPPIERERIRDALIVGLKALMQEVEASSIHVLFCTEEEIQAFSKHGFVERATLQFHWRNDRYTDFDHFLQQLRSSARKQLRKERRRVQEADVDITFLRGGE